MTLINNAFFYCKVTFKVKRNLNSQNNNDCFQSLHSTVAFNLLNMGICHSFSSK